MKTSQPGPQTAAARRSAEAELQRFVTTFAAAHQGLVDAVRRALRKRLPTAHEVVYAYRDFLVISYSPSGHGYEGVLAIRANVDGVKLYFNQGKGLPDPAKLLCGSGKQTRWIALDDTSTLAMAELAGLIEAALARNEVPFADAGRGPIVIRSVTAK